MVADFVLHGSKSDCSWLSLVPLIRMKRSALYGALLLQMRVLLSARGEQQESVADTLAALDVAPVGGWVRSTQRFATLDQCNFYAEGTSEFNIVGSAPYLYDVTDPASAPQVPPLGMRSALPLGGLGTGSVELRADGRFADWLVENGGMSLCIYHIYLYLYKRNVRYNHTTLLS
jgi:hypothetical protein